MGLDGRLIRNYYNSLSLTLQNLTLSLIYIIYFYVLFLDDMPCWATSHDYCEKYQLVYLPEFDISEEKLDEKKPPIRVRDW